MKLDDLRSIDQLRDFLEGTQDVAFAVLTGKDERYRWMQHDSDQVSLSAIVESRQRHCDPLPDEDERIFTPAGHPSGSIFIVASCGGVNARFEDFTAVIPMKTWRCWWKWTVCMTRPTDWR